MNFFLSSCFTTYVFFFFNVFDLTEFLFFFLFAVFHRILPFFLPSCFFFYFKDAEECQLKQQRKEELLFFNYYLLWLFLVNNTVYFSVLFVTGRGLHTLLLWLLTSLPFRASIIAGSNEYKAFFSSHVFPLLHSSSFIIAMEAAPCHADSHSFLVLFFCSFLHLFLTVFLSSFRSKSSSSVFSFTTSISVLFFFFTNQILSYYKLTEMRAGF